jgi:cellulose biosynthesis protein BcsQ
MKTVAFFNNKGGVGNTSLVYHLAVMYADRGIATLAIDLDPQSNLSSMFLDEDRLITIWDGETDLSIFGSIKPLLNRTGDIAEPNVERINEKLGLVVGNLNLSRFEDVLSENWAKCLDGKEDAFRVITAFHRIILQAAQKQKAQIVLIDVGPNLGAINRSALIAAEKVVIPLAADLFSLQGLENLGPTLRDWRKGWTKRLNELPTNNTIPMPSGKMEPMGYIIMQHGIREGRLVKASSERWLQRIPSVYRFAVLGEENGNIPAVDLDPLALAQLKHYRSLMPLAMEAHKAMFQLRPGDGAIGAHVEAVRKCYDDFLALAKKIAMPFGIPVT